MWTGQLLWWLPGRNASDPALLYCIWQLEQQEGAQASPDDTHILLQEVSAAMTFLQANHTVKEEAVLLRGATADWWPSQPNELSCGQGACHTGGVLCPDHHITITRVVIADYITNSSTCALISDQKYHSREILAPLFNVLQVPTGQGPNLILTLFDRKWPPLTKASVRVWCSYIYWSTCALWQPWRNCESCEKGPTEVTCMKPFKVLYSENVAMWINLEEAL